MAIDDVTPPPTRLVLIRHGESNTAVSRVIGGPRTCSGLSPLGRKQADALRERLTSSGELEADVLYASGYPRALETAEIIAAALGDLEVIEEPGFGEHDPGADLDGMSYADFVDRYGTPEFGGDPYAVTFPGGETVADFHHRVLRTLRTILDRHERETVVVACHAGVIDAVFRYCLGMRSAGGFSLYTKNTSLTELTLDGGGMWRLHRYGDAAHLAGLPTHTPTEAAVLAAESGTARSS